MLCRSNHVGRIVSMEITLWVSVKGIENGVGETQPMYHRGGNIEANLRVTLRVSGCLVCFTSSREVVKLYRRVGSSQGERNVEHISP